MNYNAETYICYGKKENRANRRSGQSTPCDERRDVGPLAFLEHSFDNLDDTGMSLSDIVKLMSIVRKNEIARCSQGLPGAPSAQHQFSLPSLSLWQQPWPRGLHMCVHAIGDKFELLQDLLCLVNNGLVLQHEQ